MVIAEAKKTYQRTRFKMARLIAIAVLGEDYHIQEIKPSGKIIRRNDDKELTRLTNIFFHNIKPFKTCFIDFHNNQYKQLSGFYNLYAIDQAEQNNKTDKSTYRVTGLKSPFGRRGSICARYGWTWDYLHHEIYRGEL